MRTRPLSSASWAPRWSSHQTRRAAAGSWQRRYATSRKRFWPFIARGEAVTRSAVDLVKHVGQPARAVPGHLGRVGLPELFELRPRRRCSRRGDVLESGAMEAVLASMRAHVVAASNTATAHASLLGASSAGNSRGDAARPAARGQQPEAADDGGHAHRQLHG